MEWFFKELVRYTRLHIDANFITEFFGAKINVQFFFSNIKAPVDQREI